MYDADTKEPVAVFISTWGRSSPSSATSRSTPVDAPLPDIREGREFEAATCLGAERKPRQTRARMRHASWHSRDLRSVGENK